mgnify:CR=1 FL=1
MKVAMITPELNGPSGIFNYTNQLIDGFNPEDEIEFSTITFKEGSLNPLEYIQTADKATSSNSTIIHIQHEYGVFGWLTLMSWVFFPTVWILAKWRNKQIVITVHEVINANLVQGRLKFVKSTYIHLINHLIGLAANHLIFLSDTSRNRFAQFDHSTPCTQIAHGSAMENRTNITQSEAKSIFGYGNNTYLISEPGYISNRKGSDLIIELANRLPEYEFILSGGTRKNENKMLERIKGKAPSNVQITGELSEEDFHASFVASDLAVLPYREETGRSFKNEVKQSGVLNWCMTYDLPVVASDCNYFSTLESQYGCLLTFPVDDIDAAVNRIKKVAETKSKRQSMSRGIEEFQKENSMETVCKEHSNVYSQLL